MYIQSLPKKHLPKKHLLALTIALGALSACCTLPDSKETQTTAQVKSVHANRMALQTKDHVMFANLESYDGDLRKKIAKGETVTLIHRDGHKGDFDQIQLQDGTRISLDSQ